MNLWLPYETAPHLEPIAPLLPVVVMSWRAYENTNHLISLSGAQELSWVGKVAVCKNGPAIKYYLTDITLLPQCGSRVHTRLDPAALATIAHQWIMEQNGTDNPCRFWGHTHPAGNTDPSLQDNAQMAAMIQGDFTPPFFIRGIFSRGQKHFNGEITIYDFSRGIIIRHAPWEVENEDRRFVWQQRVAKRVAKGVKK